MQKLQISPSDTTPEIQFSPEENIFFIRGISSPEDVRAMYYPVIDWIKAFIDDYLDKRHTIFTSEVPLKFQFDLEYFNSSSAKFLYDICMELKRLNTFEIPFIVEWSHEEADIDLKEAGEDIALLAGMEFKYIIKNSR